MDILLIDNGSRYLGLLQNLLKHQEVSIADYGNIPKFSSIKQSVVIISGGHSASVEAGVDLYKKEIELIKEFDGAILGICLGFELIAKTFGAKLKQLENRQKGEIKLEILKTDPIFGDIEDLVVYENHRWVVDTHPYPIEVLAKSMSGIEAIRIDRRNIYGVQFHPEVFTCSGVGVKILNNFLKEAETGSKGN